MSVIITGTYCGAKKVRLVHPSGTVLTTAAPLDNQGDGSSFSPTDLVAGALGACMVTVMAIFAERTGITVSKMEFSVEKEMSANPRRIAALKVVINLPAVLAEVDRTKLERVALTCPVHQSMREGTEMPVEFRYNL